MEHRFPDDHQCVAGMSQGSKDARRNVMAGRAQARATGGAGGSGSGSGVTGKRSAGKGGASEGASGKKGASGSFMWMALSVLF